MHSSPAPAGRSLWVSPGVYNSPTVWAALLPKITRSRRELAPSLLAPWTEAQAASPHAASPLTTTSFPSLS